MPSPAATLAPPAKEEAALTSGSRAGSELPPGQTRPGAHTAPAGGDPTASRTRSDARTQCAGVPLPDDQGKRDHQSPTVAGERPIVPADLAAADALLLVLADALDDTERVRIATGNRLRALRDDKRLDGTPAADALEALHGQLTSMEHALALDLKRAMRRHPLGPWVAATIGVGEKQAARLLAAIGDPGARPNPAKLWAYCGYHVIDGKRPRRRKGEKANWSNTAKMRARLIAESCIKHAHSPYRAVYDRERAKWAARDTTDGHRHNHALAVVAKAVLLDMWRAGREAAA